MVLIIGDFCIEHYFYFFLVAGDTGYGNSVNVKRTLQGYARAGMAGIMIEDQVAPKRCGHVAGKSVVSFEEAVTRVKAACDARYEIEIE